jgi:hypothetical protein
MTLAGQRGMDRWYDDVGYWRDRLKPGSNDEPFTDEQERYLADAYADGYDALTAAEHLLGLDVAGDIDL